MAASVVDNLAKKNAAVTVTGMVNEIARDFFPGERNESDRESWIKSWGPRFMRALVGNRDAPEFTDAQITDAYNACMESWKYHSPPKPAHIAERARELRPLPPMQKKHTDPTPQRTWTAEERAANIAKIEAMQAFLDSQEPEFRAVLNEHGYGSTALDEVCARHKAELKTFIENNA